MSLASYSSASPVTGLEQQKLIVVGNGMVGQKVLAALTAADTEGRYQITTFAEEPRPAYDRVHLSAYFTTRDAEALSLAPLAWFDEQGVTLHLGDGVSAIDRAQKTITTRRGEVLAYDKLVLATGSAPFIPPVPGIDKSTSAASSPTAPSKTSTPSSPTGRAAPGRRAAGPRRPPKRSATWAWKRMWLSSRPA